MKMVHVIKPSGTRFEFPFGDTATDEQILNDLASVKQQFGTAKTVKKVDPITAMAVSFPDESSGWAFDHVDTVVAVVETKNGETTEVRRLKGPPKTP